MRRNLMVITLGGCEGNLDIYTCTYIIFDYHKSQVKINLNHYIILKYFIFFFLAGRDISQDSVVYWISAFHLGCVHAKVSIPADVTSLISKLISNSTFAMAFPNK